MSGHHGNRYLDIKNSSTKKGVHAVEAKQVATAVPDASAIEYTAACARTHQREFQKNKREQPYLALERQRSLTQRRMPGLSTEQAGKAILGTSAPTTRVHKGVYTKSAEKQGGRVVPDTSTSNNQVNDARETSISLEYTMVCAQLRSWFSS